MNIYLFIILNLLSAIGLKELIIKIIPKIKHLNLTKFKYNLIIYLLSFFVLIGHCIYVYILIIK